MSTPSPTMWALLPSDCPALRYAIEQYRQHPDLATHSHFVSRLDTVNRIAGVFAANYYPLHVTLVEHTFLTMTATGP